MSHYSQERKEAVLKKLLPPHNQSIIETSRNEGISEATLYNWRNKARQQGAPIPDNPTGQWSAEAKFTAVIETALMTELELSAYCRSKGLYPEQIQHWKAACIEGNQTAHRLIKKDKQTTKKDKKRIKELERELRRKDKALAETAALLVLRKKLNALWGNGEDD